MAHRRRHQLRLQKQRAPFATAFIFSLACGDLAVAEATLSSSSSSSSSPHDEYDPLDSLEHEWVRCTGSASAYAAAWFAEATTVDQTRWGNTLGMEFHDFNIFNQVSDSE